MQKVLLGHDTLDRMHCGGAWTTVHAHPVPYTCVSFHAAAPPVGLLEAITLPKLSMATQRVMDGHDTPDKALTRATLVAVHAVAPPAGLSDVSTFHVVKSTATQKLTVGHDTPDKPAAAASIVT